MNNSYNYREISDPRLLSAHPLVSVFMLAYRHEKFLADAIESVVSQVCDFPFELIIAEDCSPDGSLAIALDYQRRHPNIVRVLTGDKNVGMHANAARNTTTVRGKYMASCEGDDYWHHPRKLQMQVAEMEKSNDIVMCHTDYDRLVKSGLKKRLHKKMTPRYLAEGAAYNDLLHGWTTITATTLYRSDIVSAFYKSAFFEPKWPFTDYNQALFAATHGRIAFLPESTATWRKTSGSSTDSGVAAYLAMAIAHDDCRERFMAAYPVTDAIKLSVRTTSRTVIMNRAFWAGRLDLYDRNNTWLRANNSGPNALGVWLKRAILQSKLLTKYMQLLRSAIFKLKRVNRS